MNREIKFRGFSEQLNKWLYGSFVTGLFENNKTKEDCPIIIDATLYPDYSCLADFDDMDCEVVASSVGQLTGLKDKNGVDVYEGDVIEFTATNTGNKTKYKVEYVDGCFTPFLHHMPQYLEVIGNIYQTPELLNL